VVLRGVQHHVNYTVDMAVSGCKGTNVQPQAAGKRRTDFVCIQVFTFNFTGLDNIFCEYLKCRVVACLNAKALHAPL
jgi:hypothetical protein